MAMILKDGEWCLDRTTESYIKEIEKTIGDEKTIWLDEIHSKKLRNLLKSITGREVGRKTTLYMAVYPDSKNRGLEFKPQPYDKLLFVLDFLRNEADEDEKGRETRVMALLNGETVCTNLAAYKLVRE